MNCRVACWLAIGILTLVTLTRVSAQDDAGLKPGDPAPAFTLPGSDGKTYRLADFVGKQPIVLAWFPKVFAKL